MLILLKNLSERKSGLEKSKGDSAGMKKSFSFKTFLLINMVANSVFCVQKLLKDASLYT